VSGDIQTYTMEKRYIRKDGSLIWINLTVSLLRDGTGAPQNFISIIEDITSRKQAETASLDSETRFHMLADNMSQLAWMANADGWLFWYNQRWYDYTGTTFEEMQGWGWKKVHHPDHVHRVEDKWRRAHATGEPWEDTFPLRSRQGVYHWFLSRAQPIRNADGRIVRWFGTNTDITELRNIQTSLVDSERRLQFLAEHLEVRIRERTKELEASRDSLRILTTELNLAEQRERKRLAGELHDYLAQWLVVGQLNLGRLHTMGLSHTAELMVEATEEVLNTALNYSRTLIAELSPPVLQEHGLLAAIRWLAEQFQRHGLSVTVDVGRVGGCRVSDDWSILLYQSVRELLMNTLKHAHTHEAVVRVEQSPEELRIVVSDQGLGFDTASMPLTTDPQCSQFGLFSLRERMKTIGGRLDVQSQPGKGTQSTLVLPIAPTGAVPTGVTGVPSSTAETVLSSDDVTPDPSELVSTQNDRIRVLLVDDHKMVRQGLRIVLETYPRVEVVAEARDGEEALTMADQYHPDIVIMDVNMPRMNGIEATAHLKRRHPTVVVIGLSVHAGPENREAMLKAGAVLLLTKEAAVRELYTAILNSIS